MRKKKKKLQSYSSSERQQNKRFAVSEDERCCGQCCVFSDEDATGNGWCGHYDIPTTCSTTCCEDYEWLNSDVILNF